MKLYIISIFFILVFISFYLEGDGASSSNIVDDVDDSSMCPICWITMSAETFTTICNHKYCEGCINNWLQRSNLCPLCRTAIYKNNGNL
ncbi:E3 ubiquitin-protein ligase RNFT1-like [Daktulosphaira vitifoliae]|uniref:E3 ubiquitin-protein ligase RNFT1-like n=1 Tax=Daktulosphaira vitifoliae TaxID=58002 RepID=UPI0021AA31D9|nr:E3 ubiquitin-protein ligase RNFT1-like [Daktulosphaira vitifoliae]